MPVTWNNGITARPTLPCVVLLHTPLATVLYMVVRCVCMQPLGWPVVPEVYGMTARSSAPACMGDGTLPAASTSAHATAPLSCTGARGAFAKSGTCRSVGCSR